MTMIEELQSLGVDVQEGIERVMGDESLYGMMIDMFVDAVRDNPVDINGFSADNLEALANQIHMLKGITGNLSMTPLFDRYTRTLGLLRNNQGAEAQAEYLQLVPIQKAIIDCIKRHKEG